MRSCVVAMKIVVIFLSQYILMTDVFAQTRIRDDTLELSRFLFKANDVSAADQEVLITELTEVISKIREVLIDDCNENCGRELSNNYQKFVTDYWTLTPDSAGEEIKFWFDNFETVLPLYEKYFLFLTQYESTASSSNDVDNYLINALIAILRGPILELHAQSSGVQSSTNYDQSILNQLKLLQPRLRNLFKVAINSPSSEKYESVLVAFLLMLDRSQGKISEENDQVSQVLRYANSSSVPFGGEIIMELGSHYVSEDSNYNAALNLFSASRLMSDNFLRDIGAPPIITEINNAFLFLGIESNLLFQAGNFEELVPRSQALIKSNYTNVKLDNPLELQDPRNSWSEFRTEKSNAVSSLLLTGSLPANSVFLDAEPSDFFFSQYFAVNARVGIALLALNDFETAKIYLNNVYELDPAARYMGAEYSFLYRNGRFDELERLIAANQESLEPFLNQINYSCSNSAELGVQYFNLANSTRDLTKREEFERKSFLNFESYFDSCEQQGFYEKSIYSSLLAAKGNLPKAAIYANESFISWQDEILSKDLTSAGRLVPLNYLFVCSKLSDISNPTNDLRSAVELCKSNHLLATDVASFTPELQNIMRGISKASSDTEEEKGLLNELSYLIRSSRALRIKSAEFEFNSPTENIRSEIAAELLSKESKIDEIQAQLSEVQDKIFLQPFAFNYDRIQETLRQDEAIIFVGDLGNKQLVSLITRNDYLTKTSPMYHSELVEKVSLVRKSVDLSNVKTASDLPKFDLDSSYTLYNSTLGLFSHELSGINHINFISSSELQALPLALLVTEIPPENYDLSDVSWAIDRYTFSRLPNLRILPTLRNYDSLRSISGSFFGVGDPALIGLNTSLRGLTSYKYETTQSDRNAVIKLPQLPETKVELERLVRLFEGPESLILTQGEATETKIKSSNLRNFSYLAFATHGLLSGELPGLSESALVLSPPSMQSIDDDGLLTSSEVSQLDLNAELVILSACNTFYEGKANSTGIAGLTASFLTAGARNILATHWSVDSKVASDITTSMIEIYKSQPYQGFSKALQKTIQRLRNTAEYEHPAFWAPFSLIGANF